MTNKIKIALLEAEIVSAEHGSFLAEKRARASRMVGNEPGAKEHEAYLAQLLGMIDIYKKDISELEASK